MVHVTPCGEKGRIDASLIFVISVRTCIYFGQYEYSDRKRTVRTVWVHKVIRKYAYSPAHLLHFSVSVYTHIRVYCIRV